MKKACLIISIILNIILLLGIGVILASNDSNTKEAFTPVASNHHFDCEKADPYEMNEDGTTSSQTRIEVDYDEDGTITKILSGSVVTYENKDYYESTLKEDNTRDLGNNTVFIYADTDVQTADATGNKYDMWFKDYLRVLKEDGYQCK